MIKNTPSRTNERTELLRAAIEHRATWAALLIDEARKQGLDTSFAHNAIMRCGAFHGLNKYPRTDDLTEFAPAFANEDVVNVFEMEIKESNEEHLHIDFHYCPLVAAWLKLGFPEEDIAEFCDIAMDGDRGIISTYPKFTFELGKTIAKGDDVCEIRIDKVK
ncbi:MAG: L-2-amino-thiazoline-4-carboxylic acid hydrolase [Clostridiaceae bacterium]|nr:L-2-amino-thiazoline-4-carboxylic acid hydrolase [Clostridiaceae bacterium]